MSNLKTSQHFLSVVNPVVKHNSLIPNPLPDLSCSRGEKSGEGLGSLLRNVDSVRTNRIHPPFLVRDVVMNPSLLPIFFHGCKIKSGSGLGKRLLYSMTGLTTNREAVGTTTNNDVPSYLLNFVMLQVLCCIIS